MSQVLTLSCSLRIQQQRRENNGRAMQMSVFRWIRLYNARYVKQGQGKCQLRMCRTRTFD